MYMLMLFFLLSFPLKNSRVKINATWTRQSWNLHSHLQKKKNFQDFKSLKIITKKLDELDAWKVNGDWENERVRYDSAWIVLI